MDLIQKASKLGYRHYTEFTIKDLNKQIEYYLIQKWLREEHKIYAYIDWHDCSSVLFKDGIPEYVKVFEHMDLERLLQEALKLI